MKIIWTEFAIQNLKGIFEYYNTNANKTIAHKIRIKILQSTHQLKTNPESGTIENNLASLKQNHRYIVLQNYKVIYRTNNNQIIIKDVFYIRQYPTKMLNVQRK